MKKVSKTTEVGPEVTNGGQSSIETEYPYIVSVTIRGAADLLFHRWNSEAVEAKAKAAKGSAAKKSDNIEDFVHRDDDGFLCVPGEYLRMAIVNAAKFKQDPRSPRKSAMDLFKAGVFSVTPLASLGTKEWDYEHKCRAVVQRQGITRTRPAVKSGYEVSFDLQVNLPEYISPELLLDVISSAGRLIGIGDFRPTYGRFQVTKFEVNQN